MKFINRENFNLFTQVIGLLVDLAGIYGYLSYLPISEATNTHSLPITMTLLFLLFYFAGVIGYLVIAKYVKNYSPIHEKEKLRINGLILGYSFFSWLPLYSLWFYTIRNWFNDIAGLVLIYIVTLILGIIFMLSFVHLLYEYIRPYKFNE